MANENPLRPHTLARLLCGQALNGELAGVPEALRPIAERLAGCPRRTARPPGGFLTGRADRDELIEAVARADPLGTPRTPSQPDAERLAAAALIEMPPAEPFPVDVLPDPVARLARETADAIGCAADFPAVNALAVAAGVIGRSVSLLLKPGYFASPAYTLAGSVRQATGNRHHWQS